jgi:hypothetical protein
VETAEAWEIALSQTATPSVLALSRQGLPTVRTEHKTKNLTAQGAYVLAEAEGKRQALLMATGSEVAIAMAARDLLQAEGIGTRVVSMPCWEIFEEQDEAYRRRVLPAGPVRVAVEAAIRFGWDRWLYGERGKREKSGFVGMHGFGASAPAGISTRISASPPRRSRRRRSRCSEGSGGIPPPFEAPLREIRRGGAAPLRERPMPRPPRSGPLSLVKVPRPSGLGIAQRVGREGRLHPRDEAREAPPRHRRLRGVVALVIDPPDQDRQLRRQLRGLVGVHVVAQRMQHRNKR